MIISHTNIGPLWPNHAPILSNRSVVMYKGMSVGKSEFLSRDWLYEFHSDYVLPYQIKIEKHKTYNGYSALYYLDGRRIGSVCCDATRELVKMKPEEWAEHLKKEFNAKPRNHHSFYFQNEEDALRFMDWVDSHRLARSIEIKEQQI